MPPVYRGATAATPIAGAQSYGELAWWSIFPDPDLQELVRTALAQNYDLQIAATRILQAQSQVTIARSQQFPTVDGSVSAPYVGYTGSDRPSTYPDNSFEPQAGLDVAWELDFWGKYRRNTESARAELLASEDARYVVMATLVTAGRRRRISRSGLSTSRSKSRNAPSPRERSRSISCRPGWTAAWPASSICGRPRRCSTRRRRRFPRSSARSSRPRTSSASCSDRIRARSSADARSSSRSRPRRCRRACRRSSSRGGRTSAGRSNS